jgi:hypothetical protein
MVTSEIQLSGGSRVVSGVREGHICAKLLVRPRGVVGVCKVKGGHRTQDLCVCSFVNAHNEPLC